MMPTELNKIIKNRLEDIEFALNESSIVAITDRRGIIRFANDKFCEISKYEKEELIGSKQNIVNSGYHSQEFFKDMWKTIGTGNVWKGEVRNQAKDGSYYWVDTTIVPFLDEDGKPDRYISIRHNITKLKEYEETIEKMAYTDALTHLPNRHYLNEWIKNDLSIKNNTLTVLFLDVDRFKMINDHLGHRAGDILLKEVAVRVEACIQETDLVIRQGGDEFVIFLNDVESNKEVMQVVEKIMAQFSNPFILEGEEVTVTTSIGISRNNAIQESDDYTDVIEKLIRQADAAMYQAKKQSRNSYSFNMGD